MVKLSNRLQLIADLIENGETVADIGTDHGFLPIFLWESRKSPKVILADISHGSLQKAVENVEKQQYEESEAEEYFDFRLGNGIEVLKEGEADTVVIAGMGGVLMTEILGSDLKKTRSIKKFILQPRNGQGKLRWWLLNNNFKITEENLVREGKFICEILTVENIYSKEGEEKLVLKIPSEKKSSTNSPWDSIEYELPESILISNGALALEFANRKLNAELEIFENMKKAALPDYEKFRLTKERITYLEKMTAKYTIK